MTITLFCPFFQLCMLYCLIEINETLLFNISPCLSLSFISSFFFFAKMLYKLNKHEFPL